VAASTRADADTLTEFYQTTLAGVQEVGPYQRIVFKTNLKLGELHYSLGHYNKLAKVWTSERAPAGECISQTRATSHHVDYQTASTRV